MVVMTVENVPRKLRGLLRRWLLELSAGVYVGKLSPVIRDLLWLRAISLSSGGRLAIAWTVNNEQGYAFELYGYEGRYPVDFDGLTLLATANLRSGSSRPPPAGASADAAT